MPGGKSRAVLVFVSAWVCAFRLLLRRLFSAFALDVCFFPWRLARRLYSRGSEVQEIQFYLYRISRFNPLINEIRIDGVYGPNTENAVSSFEKAYGLPVTGVVTETVWKKIVDVYNGTEDNIEEPDFVTRSAPSPERI